MAKKSETKTSPVEALMRAMKFAKIAFREEGETYQTHVILADKMLYAYDGLVACGHPIEEDIRACPQGTPLLAALARCKDAVALALSDGTLSLRSGKLRVAIPCADFGALRAFAADPPRLTIGEPIRAALAACAPLLRETAQTTLEVAARLASGSACASNRRTLVEYWHGFDLPGEALLPLAAIKAVLASPYELVAYGCSANSATFHFDNGAWIKTQFCAGKYPDITAILDKPVKPAKLPSDFYGAIKNVVAFADGTARVEYGPNGLTAQRSDGLTANFEVEPLEKKVVFNGADWLHIGEGIDQADFVSNPNVVYFFGQNMRGATATVVGTV